MKTPVVKLINKMNSGRFRNRFGELLLVFCLLATLLAGCTSASKYIQSLEASGSEVPGYTLGPGDKIRVTVYEHENLSGVFSVDDTGRVSLPLVRGVVALGMTVPELEDSITKQLMSNKMIDPKVSVDIVELRPVCVIGEVRTPSCFPYRYGMNGAKAIALAGGYSYRALENEFVITRKGGRKVKADHNTPVLVGDVIEVLERYY